MEHFERPKREGSETDEGGIMASCEGCGSKVGCECPESLPEDIERIAQLEAALDVAESALKTAVGHEPFNGFEPHRATEALAEIRKLRGGE